MEKVKKKQTRTIAGLFFFRAGKRKRAKEKTDAKEKRKKGKKEKRKKGRTVRTNGLQTQEKHALLAICGWIQCNTALGGRSKLTCERKKTGEITVGRFSEFSLLCAIEKH